MSKDVAAILTTVVVSWVIFSFNFVLGYYMGRAVESAEHLKKRDDEKKKNTV